MIRDRSARTPFACSINTRLQMALNSRVLIEQAKGVLAERSRITPAEAFVVMRSYSRRQKRTLTSVAAAVVDHTLQGSSGPGAR